MRYRSKDKQAQMAVESLLGKRGPRPRKTVTDGQMRRRKNNNQCIKVFFLGGGVGRSGTRNMAGNCIQQGFAITHERAFESSAHADPTFKARFKWLGIDRKVVAQEFLDKLAQSAPANATIVGDIAFSNVVLFRELLQLDSRVFVSVHVRGSGYAEAHIKHFPRVTHWETLWLKTWKVPLSDSREVRLKCLQMAIVTYARELVTEFGSDRVHIIYMIELDVKGPEVLKACFRMAGIEDKSFDWNPNVMRNQCILPLESDFEARASKRADRDQNQVEPCQQSTEEVVEDLGGPAVEGRRRFRKKQSEGAMPAVE
jgi:hypothetical protein